jgi:hypothetical protein
VTDKITIRRAQRVRLQDGDVVVLEIDRRIHPEAVDHLRRSWAKYVHAESKLVVLDDGMKLRAVLAKGAASKAAIAATASYEVPAVPL